MKPFYAGADVYFDGAFHRVAGTASAKGPLGLPVACCTDFALLYAFADLSIFYAYRPAPSSYGWNSLPYQSGALSSPFLSFMHIRFFSSMIPLQMSRQSSLGYRGASEARPSNNCWRSWWPSHLRFSSFAMDLEFVGHRVGFLAGTQLILSLPRVFQSEHTLVRLRHMNSHFL